MEIENDLIESSVRRIVDGTIFLGSVNINEHSECIPKFNNILDLLLKLFESNTVKRSGTLIAAQYQPISKIQSNNIIGARDLPRSMLKNGATTNTPAGNAVRDIMIIITVAPNVISDAAVSYSIIFDKKNLQWNIAEFVKYPIEGGGYAAPENELDAVLSLIMELLSNSNPLTEFSEASFPGDMYLPKNQRYIIENNQASNLTLKAKIKYSGAKNTKQMSGPALLFINNGRIQIKTLSPQNGLTDQVILDASLSEMSEVKWLYPLMHLVINDSVYMIEFEPTQTTETNQNIADNFSESEEFCQDYFAWLGIFKDLGLKVSRLPLVKKVYKISLAIAAFIMLALILIAATNPNKNY